MWDNFFRQHKNEDRFKKRNYCSKSQKMEWGEQKIIQLNLSYIWSGYSRNKLFYIVWEDKDVWSYIYLTKVYAYVKTHTFHFMFMYNLITTIIDKVGLIYALLLFTLHRLYPFSVPMILLSCHLLS